MSLVEWLFLSEILFRFLRDIYVVGRVRGGGGGEREGTGKGCEEKERSIGFYSSLGSRRR